MGNTYLRQSWSALVLLWLLLGTALAGRAQVYYTLGDGAATTTTDELRRSPLAAAAETALAANFMASPGPMALDAANNRLLVADVRSNLPKIVAVSLVSPFTATTFLTPAPIAGAANYALASFVVDNANGFVYYTMGDGAATTTTDELRRSPLAAAAETILTSNFAASAGNLVIDGANSRALVLDVRNNLPKIVAVSLVSPFTATTYLTPAVVAGAPSTTLSGIALPAASPPTVTTTTPATITSSSAVLGGNVTADGGAAVTGRGVVYSSTATTPAIGGGGVTQDANGSGTGTFSKTIAGLTAATTYYVRAYAINSVGTSYGNTQTFTTFPALTATVSTTSASPTSTSPIPFSVSFSQSVGTTFTASDVTVTGGTLTSGSFSGSGSGPYTFTVTPSGAGIVTVSLAAGVANDTNNTQNTASNSVSVQFLAPTIAVAPATLPGGTVGTAYSQNITASGGTAAYTYTITAGALPGGLTLTSAGVLSGTPTASGSFSFTVTATDNSAAPGPYSGFRDYAVTIVRPTIAVAPATLPGGTVGTAYSQTITASGGTAAYTYAIASGALPLGLSLSGNTLAGTPTASGTFNFRVTATDAFGSTGSRDYALVVAAPAAIAWNGSLSSDWFTAGNWTPAVVPTAASDVVIPAPVPNMPVLAAGTALAKALSINSGATVSQSGGTLDVRASLTNNGTYTATGGTVVLGTSTQASILGSSNTRFFNLTVEANGAQSSTSASTSVQQLFTLNANFTTNGNPLTLESNATNTALVVNNPSGVIVGNVTVQRYIAPDLNPGLGYRHYSAPVSNATVGSLATAGFTPVVNPNYNTSNTPNSERPFPTVYYYDQARLATSTNLLAPFDKGWTSPGALTDPLAVGRGYTVNLAANQTLAVTGPQNNGSVSQSLSRTTAFPIDAGWQLLGNPYPSPLDYSLVVPFDRLGLDAAMYVFESTSQYNGTYRANVNGVGGNANSPNAILAQGQGFFVRVTNGQTSGQLILRNSHRVTAYQNPVYHRTVETRPLVQLDLQSATGSDPLYVYFEPGATAGTDAEYDAVKLPNTTGLNLAAGAGSDKLAINGLPLAATAAVAVPLFIGLPATGTYTLHAAQVLNFGAGEQPFLRDLQLGTLTDLRLTPNYTFTMNAANTTPRFELVFGARVLGVASAKLAAQVAVYPNPARKAVFVELPFALNRKAVTAALVDALGRVVLTQVLPAGQPTYTLPLTNLATGVYSLRLQTEAGVVVKKLVVE